MKRFALPLLAFAVACGPDQSKNGNTSAAPAKEASGSVDLTGAGATFPAPIYSKWFADYATQTGVRINYQAIGSGGGIRQLSEGTVDFGASDSPMKDEEIAKAKGPVLHIPTVLGAVA
ncbi:MAG: substrate-binding domain-containing protein, partial [Gemmatimonadaceae bacterium]